jgi:hypothetical protein
MNVPLRVLGEASSYDEMIVIFRNRADELDLTRNEIDRLSGLCDGYASKTLCRPPMKNLGHISLGPTIGTLAVKLIVVEDPEQTAKILARREPRQRPVRAMPCETAEPTTLVE